MDLELIQKDNFVDFGSVDNGLRTACIISLFTDTRITESELESGSEELRGFWADAIAGNNIGSRLWLLDRRKVTRSTRIDAEEYATEALEWMIEDKLVNKIEITGYFSEKNLCLEIILTLPNGTKNTQKFNNIISNEKSRGN
jgi:phage gp46-like protein